MTTVVAGLLVRRWVVQPLDRVISKRSGAHAKANSGVIAPHRDRPRSPSSRAASTPMRLTATGRCSTPLRAREIDRAERADRVEDALASSRAEVADLPGEWSVAGELQPAEGVVAGDCYDLIETRADRSSARPRRHLGPRMPSPGSWRCAAGSLLRAGLRSGLDPADAIRWSAPTSSTTSATRRSSRPSSPSSTCKREVHVRECRPPACLHPVRRRTVPPSSGRPGRSWARSPAPGRRRRRRSSPGDTLAIYTDGVIEARSADREEFGGDRLAELVCAATCDEASAIAKQCIDEVTAFAPERTADDVTIVLLCRGPRATRG